MRDIAAELINELKVLRRGRGIENGALEQRVGPTLYFVLGVRPDASAAELRTAVRDWLTELAAQLPADLTLAVHAAFGLREDVRQRFYQDRVAWLAGYLGRDGRTALRRVDEACKRIASLAAEAARGDAVRPADSPWHTQRLNTTVVLDGASPEIVERRRIVSHQDGLTLVDLAVTVSAADGSVAESTDLGVDVLWGGTLVRTLMESSHGIGIALELAEPLAQAQHAEFAVRYRILDDKPIRPHHVCVPRYRCDRFDLRVRFGRDQPPRAVWRLTGAFQNDIDDPAEVGEIVAVDGAGEVHVRFDDLKPGFAYGARWEHSGLSDIAGVG